MEDITLYTDQDLFARISNDDREAFTLLYNRYRDKLYSFAFALSQSEQVAYDLVQDVFMKLWEQRATLANRGMVAGFLYTMIRNFRIDQVRRIAKERLLSKALSERPAFEPQTPESVSVTRELEEIIKLAIARLPDRQRQVYQFHRELGLKHAEIAEKLNLSVSTVENHLNRAMQNIRHYLVNNYPEVIIYGMVMGSSFFI